MDTHRFHPIKRHRERIADAHARQMRAERFRADRRHPDTIADDDRFQNGPRVLAPTHPAVLAAMAQERQS